MHSLLYLPIILLILTVFFLIRAEYRKNKLHISIFKPALTILVIAVVVTAMLSGDQMSPAYSVFILLALLFSLGGDIALIFQENQKAFRLGLLLFLITHIIYASAFVRFSGLAVASLAGTVTLAVLAAVVYMVLYPQLGSLKIPVLIYILIISYMLNRAIATHISPVFSSLQAWRISIGAALFYLSDLMLALNRFGYPFKSNRLSLVLYYGGQLGIALSTFGQ
ncbi:MAG TPA: lysoplasmalogenase [Candidatus Marinimicrobia bacterium]|nr:lysoplasmalogenase [Candidatus Neomarinimicrobiota bacterium]